MTSSAINNGLTLIATPIGNLRDVTFRAIDALMQADQILCEDTRVSRKLLNHYNINTKLTSYHEYNATSLRPKIIRALQLKVMLTKKKCMMHSLMRLIENY